MVPSRPSTLTESHRYAGDFMPVAGNIKSHLSTFYVDRLIISTGCFFLSPAAEPVSQSVSFRHPDPQREEEGSAATISKHRPQHGHVSSRFTPRKNDRWWSRRWCPLPAQFITTVIRKTVSILPPFPPPSLNLRGLPILEKRSVRFFKGRRARSLCGLVPPFPSAGRGRKEEARFGLLKKSSRLSLSSPVRSSSRHSPSRVQTSLSTVQIFDRSRSRRGNGAIAITIRSSNQETFPCSMRQIRSDQFSNFRRYIDICVCIREMQKFASRVAGVKRLEFPIQFGGIVGCVARRGVRDPVQIRVNQRVNLSSFHVAAPLSTGGARPITFFRGEARLRIGQTSNSSFFLPGG